MEPTDRLLENIQRTGLFADFHRSKWIALGFLCISLIGARGKKDEQLYYRTAFGYITTGLTIYFGSYVSLLLVLKIESIALIYIELSGVYFGAHRWNTAFPCDSIEAQ